MAYSIQVFFHPPPIVHVVPPPLPENLGLQFEQTLDEQLQSVRGCVRWEYVGCAACVVAVCSRLWVCVRCCVVLCCVVLYCAYLLLTVVAAAREVSAPLRREASAAAGDFGACKVSATLSARPAVPAC